MLPDCSEFQGQNVQIFGYVFHDTNGPNRGQNIRDPVVPLERHLYGHPPAGLLWGRQFEEVPMDLDGKKYQIGNACLFIEEQGLFLSAHVDENQNDWKEAEYGFHVEEIDETY